MSNQSRGILGPVLTALLFTLLAFSPATAAVFDPNWTETTWLSTGLNISGMAWAPDGSGRLFFIVKSGQIMIAKPGPPPFLVPTPFATVSPIFTNSECGLIGIAFDPDFVLSGYVYVFATVSSGEQQIIRYTAVGDVGIDKTILIPGLPTAGQNHDGGGLGFGRDGKLYWSIGDNGNGTGVDADLVSLASKVGRADRKDGSVPFDNPFIDGAGGNNDYIFARGFRNPFTLTFQPTTGTLWADVAGTSYEQVFAVSAKDHAGWNDFENNQPAGFLTPAIKYRTNGTDVRNLPGSGGAVRSGGAVTFTTTITHGFRQGEKITIAGVADASFNGAFYVASTPTPTTFTAAQAGPNGSSGGGTATTQNLGGALTGGTFYDSTGAPKDYQGNFFFSDYNASRLNRAVVGPGTTVTQVDYFATDDSNATDATVGPDGALYYAGIVGTIKRAAYNAATQGIVVSNLHMWMIEGRSVAMTVRLALAPASNTMVTVVRATGSTDVNVTSGASLTFTPVDFDVPQTVRFSAALDADTVADAAYFSVSSAGLATETVELLVADTGAVSGGFVPGRVPDGSGVAGTPLTVRKRASDPSKLDLAWGASCSGTAKDYSIYQGTLGSWYSHTALTCTTGAATAATIIPAAGNHYYLVVALDDTREGSYGTNSAGAEIPPAGSACRTGYDASACP